MNMLFLVGAAFGEEEDDDTGVFLIPVDPTFPVQSGANPKLRHGPAIECHYSHAFPEEFWSTRRKQTVLVVADLRPTKKHKTSGHLLVHAVIDVDPVRELFA